jgi:ferredoxin--NADP+ reductase
MLSNKTHSISNTASHDDAVEVMDVQHWTPQLFSFRLKRPTSFRFKAGEFVMLGLQGAAGKPVLRAYSIASPSWDDTLLFYSIKVPDGELTSQLKDIKQGDYVLLKRKSTGTLILDALKSGKKLFLFATGTGFAPFASLIREPEIYERFDSVILTHTCRSQSDLAFGEMTIKSISEDPLIENSALRRLLYYPTLTREKANNFGRITDLITSKKFFSDIDIVDINPVEDRAMICGSQEFNKTMKSILLEKGLEEGSVNVPGDFVIEKAFVG